MSSLFLLRTTRFSGSSCLSLTRLSQQNQCCFALLLVCTCRAGTVVVVAVAVAVAVVVVLVVVRK